MILHPVVKYVHTNISGKHAVYSSEMLAQTIHYLFLNINQLDALNFIMSLFHASTCFEHMCSKHVEA